MKARSVRSLLSGLALVLPLAVFAGAYAGDDHDDFGPYRLIATINNIPGNLARGFDISWVDSEAGKYYLADRGTTSIDVIDTRHNTFLYAIPLQAPGNGVVAIRKSSDDDEEEGPGELWVGDAQSFVEVVDLRTKTVSLPKISTGGNGRADELAFDRRDHILVIANDRDTPTPFITFIDTETRTNLGRLLYPQVVFFDPNPPGPPGVKGHGIEQPVWDSKTRRFYIAIPATLAHPKGEVDELEPVKTATGFGQVTNIFPTTCSPAGLALVPGQRLVTSCGDVITIKTGAILHVPGAGGDEIWFNRGDERVYFGGGLDRISVPVLDTDTNKLVLPLLTVGQIFPLPPPPQPPNQTTHSVAADSENNRIFVPVSNVGVKVYTDREDREEHHEGDDE